MFVSFVLFVLFCCVCFVFGFVSYDLISFASPCACSPDAHRKVMPHQQQQAPMLQEAGDDSSSDSEDEAAAVSSKRSGKAVPKKAARSKDISTWRCSVSS